MCIFDLKSACPHFYFRRNVTVCLQEIELAWFSRNRSPHPINVELLLLRNDNERKFIPKNIQYSCLYNRWQRLIASIHFSNKFSFESFDDQRSAHQIQWKMIFSFCSSSVEIAVVVASFVEINENPLVEPCIPPLKISSACWHTWNAKVVFGQSRTTIATTTEKKCAGDMKKHTVNDEFSKRRRWFDLNK